MSEDTTALGSPNKQPRHVRKEQDMGHSYKGLHCSNSSFMSLKERDKMFARTCRFRV